MELNSRFCEVSTYALSSGYNSSTASSSLNNFGDEHLIAKKQVKVEENDDDKSPEDSDKSATTVLIITITLVKFDKVWLAISLITCESSLSLIGDYLVF